jgi:hypothetical protein
MKRPEWESPYLERAEELMATARRVNDLRNKLGLAFRKPQQEAYEQWAYCMQEDQND